MHITSTTTLNLANGKKLIFLRVPRKNAAFLQGLIVAFVHVPDALGTGFLARRGVFPEKGGRRIVGPSPGVEVRKSGVGVG